MIAVDANVLVYAHREDSDWHEPAHRCVMELAEGRSTWAIPWPCVHEFLAIVTHPKIFNPPSPIDAAIEQIDAWLESPSVTLIGETPQYWPELRAALSKSRTVGPRVHDARIAAICMQHGVRELWSADRDFNRFSGIVAVNPLVR